MQAPHDGDLGALAERMVRKGTLDDAGNDRRVGRCFVADGHALILAERRGIGTWPSPGEARPVQQGEATHEGGWGHETLPLLARIGRQAPGGLAPRMRGR